MGDVPYEFVQAGGYVGPSFTAVFYFEDVFWRLSVPLVFGRHVQVNTLDSLPMMPVEVRRRLVSRKKELRNFLLHWADCLDYSQGFDHVRAIPPSAESSELISSAHRDLVSAIGDLMQYSPNPNAAGNSRNATEKALKAYLCVRHEFPLAGVRRFGHDVQKLLYRIRQLDSDAEFCSICAGVFPSYSARYSGETLPRDLLWDCYKTAQFTCAALMRALTPFNQRAKMPND